MVSVETGISLLHGMIEEDLGVSIASKISQQIPLAISPALRREGLPDIDGKLVNPRAFFCDRPRI